MFTEIVVIVVIVVLGGLGALYWRNRELIVGLFGSKPIVD